MSRRCVVFVAAALLAAAGAFAQPTAEALAALERDGRAKPEQTARQLETLLAQQPAAHTERALALVLLGRLYATVNDGDAAERVAAMLEALPRPVEPALAQAAAGIVRAQALRWTGPVARADRIIGEALERLPADAPVALRIRALALAAGTKEDAGRFDDAVRLYQQSIALAEPAGQTWLKSELRSSLAHTLFRGGQAERARVLNREAITLAEQADDSVAMLGAMTIEAILLGPLNEPAGELKALEAAIHHARRAGSRRDEVLMLANLADYYLRRGQYAVAFERSQEALPLARALRSPSSEALALVNSGLALIGLQRKDEGLKSARAGLAIEQRTGAIADVSGTYAELGIYLERAGYLPDALAAYEQHRKIDDEVFQRDQQRAIVELQEGFDNERRLRELTLLNRDNRLKEEQLLHRDLQQRMQAAAGVVGALTLVLVVVLVRRTRERNAALVTSNERLQRQSERDPLTGLANRRHFQAAMRERAPAGALEGSVFLVDVDHFKRINDSHGHAVGDAVLIEIAHRLRATLRDEDLIVRWGGEEFLIVVRALAPEQVETLAGRLLGAVGAAPVDAGLPVHATASIGFASFPLEPARLAVTWERAIDLVDTAMYLAKAHGRNRAYGVRLVEAANETELVQLTQELELAWRRGRVALTLLTGPVS